MFYNAQKYYLQQDLAVWTIRSGCPTDKTMNTLGRWGQTVGSGNLMSGWSEAETREYVRGVIRDLQEPLKRAVGGELQ
jgi:hypothetical protein